MSDHDAQRIDQWLWHARFFRSRSLATAALKGGQVEVNGNPAKPARRVVAGDIVRVRLPGGYRELAVLGCVPARVSAAAAATLYRETPTSRAPDTVARAAPAPAGRPDKHARRELTQVKRGGAHDGNGPGAAAS